MTFIPRYDSLKKYIFKTDPECAHKVVECALRGLAHCPPLLNRVAEEFLHYDTVLEQTFFDRTFHSPIGLAAGFDKDAVMVRGLSALGFGFLEVGTLTPKPQKGNPKPRLFRHVKTKSLQNAMGFNNGGIQKAKERLKKLYPYAVPLGLNVGKNKTTSEEDALEDYLFCIKEAGDFCDYIVINISSPNTPNLRALFNEGFISALFTEAKKITDKPILLKLSPDMGIDMALEICASAYKNGSDGFICTNTTTEYALQEDAKDFGGLSGQVLKQKSFLQFKAVAQEYFGKTLLIACGGIQNAEDIYTRIKYGADLVQIYTALIYEGPYLMKRANAALAEMLKSDGYGSIKEAKGVMLD